MVVAVVVLVTSCFQLTPLANSFTVKRRAHCVSLSLPVHSLSIRKPYVVPPRGDIRQLSTTRTQTKLQGTRRSFDPQICDIKAHWCVEYALMSMNQTPSYGLNSKSVLGNTGVKAFGPMDTSGCPATLCRRKKTLQTRVDGTR